MKLELGGKRKTAFASHGDGVINNSNLTFWKTQRDHEGDNASTMLTGKERRQ